MSFKFKVDNKFEKKLKRLSSNAKKVSGENNVPFVELFNQKFMHTNTLFHSIEEFVENSGFDFTKMESINELELDKFVNENTKFDSWEEMKAVAAEQWVAKQLGI